MIAVGLVTAILLGTTIGHTKEKQIMDNTEIEYLKKRIKKHEGYRELPYNLEYKTTDGKVVKEKSKVHAPVDTGALRRSIKYTRVKSQGRIPNKTKVFV